MLTKRQIQNFWGKVLKTRDDECWIWIGAISAGYGSLTINNKTFEAHRISYTLVHGSIPAGLYILHKCNNRKCVNPAHLYAGTYTDNQRDYYRSKKKTPEQWTLYHDSCIKCKTTTIPHGGMGLCRRCYNKALYNKKKGSK